MGITALEVISLVKEEKWEDCRQIKHYPFHCHLNFLISPGSMSRVIIRIHFTSCLEPRFLSGWHRGSLQALHMWTRQESPSQSGAPCSLRWTDGMMVLRTPAAWSTSLCPTPTWQQRSWRSTVSAAISYRLCKAEFGLRLALRRERR